LGAEADLSARWFLSPSGIFAVWAGVFAGPVAWALDLGVSYALVQWSCGHHTQVVLRLITFASLALVAAGAYASWRALMNTPRNAPLDGPQTLSLPALVISRGRFMAVLGLASSALFAVLVVALGVPRWVLNAC
jgi:hypothetical protein